MNNSQFPTARTSDLVVQEVPDELLVYDLNSNEAHCLNRTAALVWKACDGRTSVSDIARIVETQAGGKVSDDLIWLAIDQLSEKSLLQQDIKSHFAGQSRREVIRKIGLAAVVGIPVVASLMAPQSARAGVGSCGAACSTSVDCTAGLDPCTLCSSNICV